VTAMSTSSVGTELFEAVPGWRDAAGRLGALVAEHGTSARQAAERYAAVYERRRAAMVVDVVLSRQRRYKSIVLPEVEAFEETEAASSLAALAQLGPLGIRGLRSGEADTIRATAPGLLRHSADRGLDDEAGVRSWAELVAPFEHAPELDPCVGSVKGIGLALFAYMRMRSGADAIKPDVRVRKALRRLGFPTPAGEHALLVVARAAAQEVGFTRLELDQLLWAAGVWACPADRRRGRCCWCPRALIQGQFVCHRLGQRRGRTAEG